MKTFPIQCRIIQRITIPQQDIYQFNLAIFGQGIDYKQTYAGIADSIFEIGPPGQKLPTTPTPTPVQEEGEILIPDWVRNNAGWWSAEQISDNDFASGLEFMIKEGIIKVPPTDVAEKPPEAIIPDWVRNNAGLWSEGLISDEDFANGIQYLIENGIISV